MVMQDRFILTLSIGVHIMSITSPASNLLEAMWSLLLECLLPLFATDSYRASALAPA